MVLQVGAAMLTLISIDTVSSAKLRSSMLQPYGAVTAGTVASVVSCLGMRLNKMLAIFDDQKPETSQGKVINLNKIIHWRKDVTLRTGF